MAKRKKPKPFDPNDDFDALADVFRRHVAHMYLMAQGQSPFAQLPPVRQLECFLCGVLTGVLGVSFACVMPEGRDDVMKMLADYLPQARLNVEDMLREGLH